MHQGKAFMKDLTPRQEEILNLIRECVRATGSPPTRAEISRHFGFSSPNAAEQHLRGLARKGALELVPGVSRGIQLKGDAGLPLVGRVAAGSPVLAQEHIERHVQIDAAMFSPRADYLLKVHGTSMQGVGILDGDLLAVHRSAVAQAGQIVVARLGDEVTVKRFEKRGNHVRLMPENPAFEPIEVDLAREELVIEGIAVGVIRSGLAP